MQRGPYYQDGSYRPSPQYHPHQPQQYAPGFTGAPSPAPHYYPSLPNSPPPPSSPSLTAQTSAAYSSASGAPPPGHHSISSPPPSPAPTSGVKNLFNRSGTQNLSSSSPTQSNPSPAAAPRSSHQSQSPQQQPHAYHHHHHHRAAASPSAVQISLDHEVAKERKSEWNHRGNLVTTFVRTTWEGTKDELKKGVKTKNLALASSVLHRAISAKTDIHQVPTDSNPNEVTIHHIKVISRGSNFPHDIGIVLKESSGQIDTNHSYITAGSDGGYTYIIPAKSAESPVNIEVYAANSEVWDPLIGGFGGVSREALRKQIKYLDENSDYAYVHHESRIIESALTTLEAMREGKTDMTDPKLTIVDGDVQVTPEGFVSVSRTFVEGFMEQLESRVMSVAKPVDIQSINLTPVNVSGLKLTETPWDNKRNHGGSDISAGDKIYRCSVDLEIQYFPRHAY